MSLYVRSDHNQDSTLEVLSLWLDRVSPLYHHVNATMESDWSEDSLPKSARDKPAEWTDERFSHIIRLREEALREARRTWADRTLFLDADVFLTDKNTIRYNQFLLLYMLLLLLLL